MPITKLLSIVAVIIAAFAIIVAVANLVDIIINVPAPGVLIDQLRGWVDATGYRLSLVILATTATLYLAKKK